jgi:Transglycosylase
MLYARGTSLGSELKQVGVVFRLDLQFSKQRILALYLDAAYFGDGANGVTAAAEHYYGLVPAQLSWARGNSFRGSMTRSAAYRHLPMAGRQRLPTGSRQFVRRSPPEPRPNWGIEIGTQRSHRVFGACGQVRTI